MASCWNLRTRRSFRFVYKKALAAPSALTIDGSGSAKSGVEILVGVSRVNSKGCAASYAHGRQHASEESARRWKLISESDE
jgi:hypothetical protein